MGQAVKNGKVETIGKWYYVIDGIILFHLAGDALFESYN